ncbi:uncharacterized protein DUF1217 [Breoghania corrubedonensis]|uniref:Uncharacterized protein DUF1217 n=1 Tax=Breoghania corrubedonensis TaxID=665038 RepID=A0A2T5V8V0_9HYPH|nr:DUF1217 domain-containing protein [Breoghania corrubedonensis]PTW60182.1 uncharacterized protein DUF1217 [Breoghania corrubedonensis]
MISTLLQYQIVTKNLDRSLTTVATDPVVKRQSAYYLENIGNVKSIDDFLEDDQLFDYAMKAFGLEDMDYAKAFMRKVLEEGTDKDDSFANQLADEKYATFAKTFNFARYGEATTSFDRTQQDVVDAYMRQTLEENEGSSNEGVRLALYFSRKASQIDSGMDLLADKAMAQVVYTALGLPDEFASADIDKQAAFIADRIDIEDFQDPEKTEKFLARFTAMYDMKNKTATATSPALQVITSANKTVAMDESLLASIQNLKLGGM